MRIGLALLALIAANPVAMGRSSVAATSTHGPEDSTVARIQTCEAKTTALFLDLAQGHASAAMEHFSNAMRSRLNTKGLVSLWADMGEEQSRYHPQPRVINGLVEVTVPLHFAAGDFITHLSCGPDGKLRDFQLAPISRPLPPPAATSTFREVELEIGKPPMRLGTTLTLPNGKGPFPGVVLVSGAGVHDRDESFGSSRPLRDIARGLADYGIASLRYDKPAFDHPLAFIDTPYTIDNEYTDPALDAINRLRITPKIDPQRVFLLGHSQGGEMAPRIGQREPSIAGLILVAAPAKTLPEYFQTVEQSSRRLARLYPQYANQIQQNTATVAAIQNWLAQADPKHPEALGPDGAPASYWLSLRAYKSQTIAVAKALKQPMLILQGGRDDSVSPKDDFGRWQLAFAHNPRVTLKEYPTLSHLMTPVSASRQSAASKNPVHVDGQVIEDIARWILAQKPAHEDVAGH
jgi:hypothetical protein